MRELRSLDLNGIFLSKIVINRIFQWVQNHYSSNILLLVLVCNLLYGCTRQASEQPLFTPTITSSPSPTHKPTPSKVRKKKFIKAREQLVVNSIELQGLQNEDVINALDIVPRNFFPR